MGAGKHQDEKEAHVFGAAGLGRDLALASCTYGGGGCCSLKESGKYMAMCVRARAVFKKSADWTNNGGGLCNLPSYQQKGV